ncbi:MAG: hypothetical protein QXU75_06650 [Candidatus Methanomethylicaceae archaeon]
MAFNEWVKPTFTDFDKLLPGEVVCDDCLFYFDESSEELARRVGKEKPQRMRNYSHFVVDGQWYPLSKADKEVMKRFLLEGNFPELAAIAESGQKHIVFRAMRNPIGQESGWVQFEEQRVFVERAELRYVLDRVEELYEMFSKDEIAGGQYNAYRIQRFGIDRWHALEGEIKRWRGKPLFYLALFLAQRSEEDGHTESERASRNYPDRHLAGDTQRLQEPLSGDNLGSIRESGQERGLYQQPAEIHQYTLFEIGGEHRDEC